MIYSFLTVHRLTVSAMAVALARAVGVPSTAVDIADEDSVEDRDGRNWDALVLCGYHAVAGDVALAWEVSVADAVPDPPDEAEAARSLAALSGTTVLYPAEETVPSAYWAAAPDGTVTRARVVEAGASGGAVVVEVEAVETAVAQLPSARVQLLPEIFREEKVPTPVADAFAALTDADGSAPAAEPGEPGPRGTAALGASRPQGRGRLGADRPLPRGAVSGGPAHPRPARRAAVHRARHPGRGNRSFRRDARRTLPYAHHGRRGRAARAPDQGGIRDGGPRLVVATATCAAALGLTA